MRQSSPYSASSAYVLTPFLLFAAVFLLGSAAVELGSLHDQQDLRQAQAAELKSNNAVFAISDPDSQPAGIDVAAWDEDGYDGTRHFRVRFGQNGEASLSDPYEPTAAVGRQSNNVALCTTLHLNAYEVHGFKYGGKSYRVLLTSNGNAAVCLVG